MGIHALRVSERFAPHLEAEKEESHNSRTHAFLIVLADISLPFLPLISNPFSSLLTTCLCQVPSKSGGNWLG
jgi:hypothetical protein